MPPELTLRVVGEEPLDAEVPVFSNFVAVSQAGSEVQFEFVFLDLNQVAKLAAELEASGGAKQPEDVLQGRTVAKVIVPVASFVQLKTHLNQMFEKLEAKISDTEEKARERKNA